jgi:predicted RNA-binding Zn-ribbon protein involved in translation (DUF1610 family)
LILFKACPRCGGDIDATYQDDVRCVQCSHRPEVKYPGPRVVQERARPGGVPQSGPTPAPLRLVEQGGTAAAPDVAAAAHLVGADSKPGHATCPRCGVRELARLDRLRPQDHVCYRCRLCGHIFSPASADGVGETGAALP